MIAITQQHIKINYYNYSSASLMQRLQYRFFTFENKKEYFESLKMVMYNDNRYTDIATNATDISLDLSTQFKVATTEETYISFKDFVSTVGGLYSSLTLVFITVPTAALLSGKFLNAITEHLHKKEERRNKRKKNNVELSKEDIKKRYLKRVSHEGIWDLYNYIEEIIETN